MAADKLDRNIDNFEKAIQRFAEALQEPESSIVRDATIQRFEFTYELMWKTLKNYLEDIHGIRAISPRQVFKEAFALEIIENEGPFLEMIKARNLLSHTYNEDQSIEIYRKCPLYLPEIERVFGRLTVNRQL